MQLEKGQKVVVVGASSKRGHLLVEHNEITINIPYQFLELVPSPKMIPSSINGSCNGQALSQGLGQGNGVNI